MKPITMHVSHVSSLLLALAVAASLVACGKKEQPAPVAAPAPPPLAAAPAAPDLVAAPVSVKQVVLSNKIDDAKRAAGPMSAFAPTDTIYASVETVGSGKAALKALWTYHKGDKTAQVSEVTQEIDAKGPAHTEFHVSKPGGWPTGDYQVEVFMNGASASTQKFAVN
jgi:hypothetical protein